MTVMKESYTCREEEIGYIVNTYKLQAMEVALPP
jgi:hypothetical protein